MQGVLLASTPSSEWLRLEPDGSHPARSNTGMPSRPARRQRMRRTTRRASASHVITSSRLRRLRWVDRAQPPASADWARRIELVSVLVASLVAVASLWYSNAQTTQAIGQARQDRALTKEGQITDRYTAAVENLGADKLDVRLGGIYALERIMQDSHRDHPTIANVLATYVRTHASGQSPKDQGSPADVQAALSVLATRDTDHDRQFALDLHSAWLTKADVATGPSGDDPPRAQLAAADLSQTHWREADLYGANLRGAYLKAAELRDAMLDTADLRDAHLFRADLRGAYLFEANLRGAFLHHADLRGARMNADLRGAALDDADLRGAVLSEADLRRATAYDAKFNKVDLSDADLRDATLIDATLNEANLSGANLRGADLIGVELRDTVLTNADLRGADLSGAQYAEKDQFDRVRTDKETRLPDGLS